MLAALSVPGGPWAWVALAAAVVLVPLAWLALAPAGARARAPAFALALRILGVGLLALCLLDPQWTTKRAVAGANLVAVLADNGLGLTVADAGATVSRGAGLREALMNAEDRGWLAALGETFSIRRYAFDRDVRRIEDFASLDFTGDRSNLFEALTRLRERLADQPLAGVILLTDGIATDVGATPPDLAGLPPVHPVLVGGAAESDLRIDRIEVAQTAFEDAPVSVRATVSGSLGRAADVGLTLRPLSAGGIPSESDAPLSRRVRIAPGEPATTTFTWSPPAGGVRFLRLELDPGAEDATPHNNRGVVVLDGGADTRRILYVGGRPNWEFKFLNRALLDDPRLRMVGLLRVARREPKFDFKGRSGESSNPMFRGFEAGADEAPRYDQPVLVRVNARDAQELRAGFPTSAEELFAYDAVVLDDVEAAFFTLEQQALLRRFVSDRGGGLLVLGGADALENGGYRDSPLAAALPAWLPEDSRRTAQGALRWSSTREGRVQPWTRVRATEGEELARLANLPRLSVLNNVERMKPGAAVLAEVEDEAGARFPALITQPFGAGRVACLLAGDLWRWGLTEEGAQTDLARFWRQLARWLVTDVPAQVDLRADTTSGPDTTLRIVARDRAFRFVDGARATVTITRVAPLSGAGADSGFSSVTVPAEPLVDGPGRFTALFRGRDAGAYVATVDVTAADGTSIGVGETGWVNDPARAEFRTLEPDRELLAGIARRTGGTLLEAADLPGFVASLPSRAAPIEEHHARPAWNNAWVFLVVLACFATEWWWRRRRGLP